MIQYVERGVGCLPEEPEEAQRVLRCWRTRRQIVIEIETAALGPDDQAFVVIRGPGVSAEFPINPAGDLEWCRPAFGPREPSS